MSSFAVHDWVEQQSSSIVDLGQLAALRHKEMAQDFNTGEDGLGRRSPRVDFCKSVAARAMDIATKLVKSQG
jgi:hypothetical protein